MGKVTEVSWYCDKCGTEVPERPNRVYKVYDNDSECVDKPFSRVTIDFATDVAVANRYSDNFESYLGGSMLCASCKKEILESVIKKLKKEISRGR